MDIVNSMSDALGGFGSMPKVTVGKGTPSEKTYVFLIDAPLVVSEMEQMCMEWGRKRFHSRMKDLVNRDKPGTLDHELAREEWAKFTQQSDEGYYLLDGPGHKEFSRSREGKLSTILAAIRPNHPDACDRDVMRLMSEAPEETQAVLVQLGKGIAAMSERIIAGMANRTLSESGQTPLVG